MTKKLTREQINHEIIRVIDILKLKDELELRDYISCKCPEELRNGNNGFFHVTPIDCAIKPQDIIDSCQYRIECINETIKKLENLKQTVKLKNETRGKDSRICEKEK